MSALYEIPDEPRASRFAPYATDPIWPLLGLALGGPLLGFIWLALNAAALGCRDLAAQIGLSLLAYVGSRAALIGVGYLAAIDAFDRVAGPAHAPLFHEFALIAIDVTTLFIGFVLLTRQALAAELHAFFGRPMKNLLPIALILAVINIYVIGQWNSIYAIFLFRFVS